MSIVTMSFFDHCNNEKQIIVNLQKGLVVARNANRQCIALTDLHSGLTWTTPPPKISFTIQRWKPLMLRRIKVSAPHAKSCTKRSASRSSLTLRGNYYGTQILAYTRAARAIIAGYAHGVRRDYMGAGYANWARVLRAINSTKCLDNMIGLVDTTHINQTTG